VNLVAVFERARPSGAQVVSRTPGCPCIRSMRRRGFEVLLVLREVAEDRYSLAEGTLLFSR
jgi:hypothetical protein